MWMTHTSGLCGRRRAGALPGDTMAAAGGDAAGWPDAKTKLRRQRLRADDGGIELSHGYRAPIVRRKRRSVIPSFFTHVAKLALCLGCCVPCTIVFSFIIIMKVVFYILFINLYY